MLSSCLSFLLVVKSEFDEVLPVLRLRIEHDELFDTARRRRRCL